MASGGNHPPANPAAASGPGALSQRTDQPKMQLSDPKYGEQTDFQQIQGGAPVPEANMSGQAPAPQPVPLPTEFGAPTQNPGEPVTAGADQGAGVGTEALNLPKGDTRPELRRKYGPIMPALLAEAQSQYATQAFKDSVTALLAIF